MSTQEQEMMNAPMGNTEKKKEFLKPAKVKIVNIEIVKIEKAKAHKVVFEVKHPDKTELIKISSISLIQNKNVVNSGSWVNLDEKNALQKGSALFILLEKLGAKNISECKNKECETELENNFLCLKAY